MTSTEQEIIEKILDGITQLLKDGTIVKLNSDSCSVDFRINMPENAIEKIANEVMAEYVGRPNV